MTRALGVLTLCVMVVGCGNWNPPNDPSKVPSSYGACGSWVDCGADQPKADRCCPPTTACAVDDGGPYCAADETRDPSDPVTWSRRERIHRRAPP